MAQLGKVVTVSALEGGLSHAGEKHRVCCRVHHLFDVTTALNDAECIFLEERQRRYGFGRAGAEWLCLLR